MKNFDTSKELFLFATSKDHTKLIAMPCSNSEYMPKEIQTFLKNKIPKNSISKMFLYKKREHMSMSLIDSMWISSQH